MKADAVLDADTVTVGELAVFEEFTGWTIEETITALQEGRQTESATFLVAVLFVNGARTDPGWTIEQASAVVFADVDDWGG